MTNLPPDLQEAIAKHLQPVTDATGGMISIEPAPMTIDRVFGLCNYLCDSSDIADELPGRLRIARSIALLMGGSIGGVSSYESLDEALGALASKLDEDPESWEILYLPVGDYEILQLVSQVRCYEIDYAGSMR